MNVWLTAISIAVLPLVAWPISRFGRRLRTASRASLDSMAGLSEAATESLSGIEVVSTHCGEAARRAHFDAINDDHRRLQMRAFLAKLSPGPIVELIAAVGVGAVLWVGGQQVFAGTLQPGELIAFMIALGLLNEPLKGISKIHELTQQARAASQRSLPYPRYCRGHSRSRRGNGTDDHVAPFLGVSFAMNRARC